MLPDGTPGTDVSEPEGVLVQQALWDSTGCQPGPRPDSGSLQPRPAAPPCSLDLAAAGDPSVGHRQPAFTFRTSWSWQLPGWVSPAGAHPKPDPAPRVCRLESGGPSAAGALGGSRPLPGNQVRVNASRAWQSTAGFPRR